MSRITSAPQTSSIIGKILTRCSTCDGYGFSRNEAICGVYDQYSGGHVVLARNVECRHVAELAGRRWQLDGAMPFAPAVPPESVVLRDPTGETQTSFDTEPTLVQNALTLLTPLAAPLPELRAAEPDWTDAPAGDRTDVPAAHMADPAEAALGAPDFDPPDQP